MINHVGDELGSNKPGGDSKGTEGRLRNRHGRVSQLRVRGTFRDFRVVTNPSWAWTCTWSAIESRLTAPVVPCFGHSSEMCSENGLVGITPQSATSDDEVDTSNS
jgi:hypothetical protein